MEATPCTSAHNTERMISVNSIYRGFDISKLNTERCLWCAFYLEKPQAAFVESSKLELKKDIDRYWSRRDMQHG